MGRAIRVIALPILLAAAAGACGPSGPSPTEGYITVGIRTAPNTLDPRQGGDEASQRVAQLIFSPLMQFGDDLHVRPWLAERLDNPDPLTYIVILRRGVRFHDGRPLTAKDVVYTFGAFLDPDYISPFKGAYSLLQSVRALDDYTIEFRLKEPFAAFPTQLVNTPPVVPEGAGDSMRTHPIGSGPYKFVRYDVDDQVVLEAFDEYWGGPPKNRGVIVKIIPDDTMRGLELRKQSVDLVANDLPPDIVHQLEKSGEFRVTRSPGLDFSYIGFNMRDRIVSDKRVRHAVGFAINREAIVKYLRRGLASPAFGLLPPQAWAFEPDVFQFRYDPDESRRLLDEAGYPDPPGPEPRLRLSLRVSTAEEVVLQATVIQQDLARVGIDLDVRASEFATLREDVEKGNFQLFSLQWVGGGLVDPDMLRRVFHSSQVPRSGFNRGHYSNPLVDRLLDRATVAGDEATRRLFYGEAQKVIAEDAPYIPIWNRVNVLVAQPTLTNLHLTPTGDLSALREVARASE